MAIDSIQIPQLLTPDELAKLLGISKVSIYRKVEKRQIPFYKIGGCIRFSREDIREFINQNRIESIV